MHCNCTSKVTSTELMLKWLRLQTQHFFSTFNSENFQVGVLKHFDRLKPSLSMKILSIINFTTKLLSKLFSNLYICGSMWIWMLKSLGWRTLITLQETTKKWGAIQKFLLNKLTEINWESLKDMSNVKDMVQFWSSVSWCYCSMEE